MVAASKAPGRPFLGRASAAARSASSNIAVLAAQAQAAHLVALLARNQQLLSGVRSALLATAGPAVQQQGLTGSDNFSRMSMGGQQQGLTGSDNFSRMSTPAPFTTLHPGEGGRRDNTSRRLSAILLDIQSEADGFGDGGNDVQQQR